MSKGYRAALINLSVLAATILLGEVALQIASRTSFRAARALAHPRHRDVPFVFDRDRGLRGNPKRFDHDSRGYRNAFDIEKADVLAIGDSQTYGAGVLREQAWPAVLGQRTGLDVYSMALGGYAAPHHLVDIKRMLDLKPDFVVYGVYFGNDFLESFDLAKQHPELHAHVPDALWEAAMLRESEAPLGPSVELFARRGEPPPQAEEPSSSPFDRVRTFASEQVRMWALMRSFYYLTKPAVPTNALLSRDFDVTLASLTDTQLEYCAPYDDSTWRTILTAPYRNFTLDRTDPRIQAGFLVNLHALERIMAEVRGRNAEMIIALIPTKETVFAERLADTEDILGLSALVENERYYRDKLVEMLRGRRVTVLDLRLAIGSSVVQPYFQDADGHLNEAGSAVVAKAIESALAGRQARIL